jgi:hypothetical protein
MLVCGAKTSAKDFHQIWSLCSFSSSPAAVDADIKGEQEATVDRKITE